ncbi:hypothetical protein P3W43_01540 [Salinicola salarius]|uniref:phage tail fiber protein n=1 Tax=Salinicola salarius TaxID=430457 RepID=UPI0023E3B420|nr:hypothetical protein [Salinicola salarius]MDF3917532.1 hypothetical protein [Salinicola salarius]
MADVDLVPLNEAYRDAIAAGRELTQNMKNWTGVIQNDGQLGDAAAADTLSQIAVGNAAAVRAALDTDPRKWGLGSQYASIISQNIDNNTELVGQFGLIRETGLTEMGGFGCLLAMPFQAGRAAMMYVSVAGSTTIKFKSTGSSGSLNPSVTLYHTGNTTVDSNGFLKAASPIFRLANVAQDAAGDSFTLDGCGAYNSEAEGVTASHDDVGVYTVSGSLGFADDGWTIEIPQDVNGNRLCFVETETADNGTITVRTFGRRFDYETAMIVAGEPIDIPDGRWIDLRLKMPAPEVDETDDSAEQEPTA